MKHNLQPTESVTKRTTKNPCPWLVCARCGLVALKNDETRKALRAACPGAEDAPP